MLNLPGEIWNGFPEHLRTKNKTSFKKSLQQTILKLFEHEENYVDVHTLIQKYQAFVRSLLIEIKNILRIYRLIHASLFIYLFICNFFLFSQMYIFLMLITWLAFSNFFIYICIFVTWLLSFYINVNTTRPG